MQDLARYFPEGVKYDIPYDTSPFVKVSIEQVINTLFEAMLLVFAVMFLFLQNLRYTLIPTLVVPVALMGTFAVMLAMGFSVNVLTLFGMVLAIGILVDDAIVVVENVERIMAEEGLPPKEATRKAMGQISGAIVGITLVLVAVFLPMAFMQGSVGVIYQQFSLSMAVSILFSAFLALSLTPGAVCHPAQAGGQGRAPRTQGLLRLVQPALRGHEQRLPALGGAGAQAQRPLPAGIRVAAGGAGLWLQPAAHGVPAHRRPGLHHHRYPAAAGRQPHAHRAGGGTDRGAQRRRARRG
jgi:Cu/Ag efflux pump CusA